VRLNQIRFPEREPEPESEPIALLAPEDFVFETPVRRRQLPRRGAGAGPWASLETLVLALSPTDLVVPEVTTYFRPSPWFA